MQKREKSPKVWKTLKNTVRENLDPAKTKTIDVFLFDGITNIRFSHLDGFLAIAIDGPNDKIGRKLLKAGFHPTSPCSYSFGG